MKFMHVGASIQRTRTEKTVSKSFPFSCSEPPTVSCKTNESEMCKFRSLSLQTFDEMRESFRDVLGTKRETLPFFSRPVPKFIKISRAAAAASDILGVLKYH